MIDHRMETAEPSFRFRCHFECMPGLCCLRSGSPMNSSPLSKRIVSALVLIVGTWSVWVSVAANGASPAMPTGDGLPRTNLLVFRGTTGGVQPVKNVEDWKKRRASIIAAMQSIMGPLPGPEKRCALEVKIEGEVNCGSYVRRSISYS